MKNFKFHFGHAMVLALVAFIVFILSMVLQVNHIQLVKEDYYIPDEIVSGYIQSQKRYNSLPEEIKPKFRAIKDSGLFLIFPKNWNQEQTKGRLVLLRPSEANDDITLEIKLDKNNQMLIPKEKLVEGLYQITLDFGQISEENYSYRLKLDNYKW